MQLLHCTNSYRWVGLILTQRLFPTPRERGCKQQVNHSFVFLALHLVMETQGHSAGMACRDCGSKHSVSLRAITLEVQACLLSHHSFQSIPSFKQQSSREHTPADSICRPSRKPGKKQEKLRVETQTYSKSFTAANCVAKGLVGCKGKD